MDLGQQLAGLPDQVGLDLDAEGQVRSEARFGDLPQLIDHLRQVIRRVGAPGVIERKAANQLGLERVGDLAGPFDFFFQVLLERHVGVLGAVVDVEQLDLADRRADRGDVQGVLVLQVADLLNLAARQLHDVLDAAADIDEPQAVILQSQRGQRGKLLHGRLLVGGFVGKSTQNDLRLIGHARVRQERRIGRTIAGRRRGRIAPRPLSGSAAPGKGRLAATCGKARHSVRPAARHVN